VSWSFTTVNSAPTVVSRVPANGASGVAVTLATSAAVSRAMDASTLTASSCTLSGTGGAVAASVRYNAATLTATLTPSASLANNTLYTAALDTTVKAADGVALASAVSWSFTTVNSNLPPTVTSVSPAAGSINVSRTTKVTATFSVAMDATTITATSFTLKNPSGAVVSASVAYDSPSKTATLTPSKALSSL